MRIQLKPLLSPTLLLALSALLSRLLGVLRDHLLATTFGATSGVGITNLDTYYAAFRIPDLLYNLVIFGAISSAFIPLFTRYKKENKMKEAWEFASNMLHLMLALILFCSVLAFLFAPFLARLVAGGFDAVDHALTVQLMRIMLLSPILFTFSAIFISIQDSFKAFFFRSLAPLFYNLGIIVGIFFFSDKLGVVGVTWGVIIGAFLQLIIQIPAMTRLGVKHFWIMDTKRQDVQKAFKLMIPRILGLSMTQFTLLLNTFIASFLVTGSITVFYLADNLQALPLGIIGISFAITSFATLSELAMEETPKAFSEEIGRVAQKVLFLIIPATFGMLLLRHEMIDLILVGGAFGAQDARMTADTLGLLLISLFAQSLIPLFSRGFFAYHNTQIPFYAALIGAFVSVAGGSALALPFGMGIQGIALATSVGTILNFVLLYVLMVRQCRSPLLVWWNVVKMILASGLMLLATFGAQKLVPYGGSLHEKAFSLFCAVALGMVVYFIVASLLGINTKNQLIKSR